MCEQMICSCFFSVFTTDANSPGTTTDDDGTGEVAELAANLWGMPACCPGDILPAETCRDILKGSWWWCNKKPLTKWHQKKATKTSFFIVLWLSKLRFSSFLEDEANPSGHKSDLCVHYSAIPVFGSPHHLVFLWKLEA